MKCAPAIDDDQLDSDVLPVGAELLNGQYVIERYLSSGGFGITYLARDSLERSVVIKECFPEAFCSRKNRTVVARARSQQHDFQGFVDMFVREARSIAKLKHPNIVGVHQVFQDNETAYMALDRIDGTDLLDVIEASDERPPYAKVKTNLLKLLDAISTVHAQDMLHRDISPDNILIDGWGNPVLIDFGAAREEASKKSRALSAILVVKDGYSPQEFYISGSKQTASSDLYALAATFFHLISGEMPPDSQTRLAAIALRKEDPYQTLKGRIDGYPDPFLDAIDTCMNVFPQDRLQSAKEWILCIDEDKRVEAAQAQAKCDKGIEQTILQLIQASEQEPAHPPSKVPIGRFCAGSTLYTSRNEAQKVVPTSSHDTPVPTDEVQESEVVHKAWPAADLQYQSAGPESDQPKRYLKLHGQQAQSQKSASGKSRIAARLVLSASLCLLAVSGNSKSLAQALGPIVLHVVEEVEKLVARVG